MDQNLPDDLEQAVNLLRTGQTEAARPILMQYVKQYPGEEQGWFFLGIALSDSQQQAECFVRVLKINPNNHLAQERLEQLVMPASLSLPHQESAKTMESVNPPEADSSKQESYSSPQLTPIIEGEGVEIEETPSSQFPSMIQSPPVRIEKKPTPKRRKTKNILLTILIIFMTFVVLLLCLIAVSLGFQYLGYDIDELLYQVQNTSSSIIIPKAAPTIVYKEPEIAPTEVSFVLPPTWTPTNTPTSTPIPSTTPTQKPTSSPTLPPPAPTIGAQMDRIAKEVSNLRGLPILNQVPGYLITRTQAKTILSDLMLTDELKLKLHDEAIVLSSLGLIEPNYDLENYILNGQVDGIGGIYIPWEKEIYILGIGFRGMEHFIYSHEFDHALTDQHFDINGMGVYPVCESNEQRCSAIRALIEGDASLIMYRWAERYATQQDYRDLLAFQPPIQALPEKNPPPYVLEDLNFPYKYGTQFVQYLLDRGNWNEVDKAYQNLPESTEQILHPEKYLEAEPPLQVQVPDLEVLGGDWQLIKSEVLGEWMSYLLLAFGADYDAQIEPSIAQTAVRGWGGDHYLVYHSKESNATILTAQWLWDTQSDAEEFKNAMVTYLNNRFLGKELDHPTGDCWETNQQSTCLYQEKNQVLWLLTPNITTLDSILALYDDFQ